MLKLTYRDQTDAEVFLGRCCQVATGNKGGKHAMATDDCVTWIPDTVVWLWMTKARLAVRAWRLFAKGVEGSSIMF